MLWWRKCQAMPDIWRQVVIVCCHWIWSKNIIWPSHNMFNLTDLNAVDAILETPQCITIAVKQFQQTSQMTK